MRTPSWPPSPTTPWSTTRTGNSGATRPSAAGWPGTEVLDHHGDTIVRGRYDGDYDKTNLPDELILTSYFTVRDGKIVTLIVIRNTPASY